MHFAIEQLLAFFLLTTCTFMNIAAVASPTPGKTADAKAFVKTCANDFLDFLVEPENKNWMFKKCKNTHQCTTTYKDCVNEAHAIWRAARGLSNMLAERERVCQDARDACYVRHGFPATAAPAAGPSTAAPAAGPSTAQADDGEHNPPPPYSAVDPLTNNQGASGQPGGST